MKVTLDLSGTDLMVLYISTGNESARALILESLEDERLFKAGQRELAASIAKLHVSKAKER